MIQDNIPDIICNLDISNGVKLGHASSITESEISALLCDGKYVTHLDIFFFRETEVIFLILTMENCDVIFLTFFCRNL